MTAQQIFKRKMELAVVLFGGYVSARKLNMHRYEEPAHPYHGYQYIHRVSGEYWNSHV